MTPVESYLADLYTVRRPALPQDEAVRVFREAAQRGQIAVVLRVVDGKETDFPPRCQVEDMATPFFAQGS